MDLLDIVWIRRIDERPDNDDHVASADRVLRERVAARAIGHRGYIVVLVEGHQGHEPCACIRHCDRHRCSIEIEHCRRIEGVAVEANDGLVVDCSWLATMEKFSKGSVFDHGTEIQIGFCANEILRSDENAMAFRWQIRFCMRCRDNDQRQRGSQRMCNTPELHTRTSFLSRFMWHSSSSNIASS